MKSHIDFLLTYGGDCVRYRTQRDLLGVSPKEEFMRELQAKIIAKPKVQRIFACQHEDGWIGSELHGQGHGKAFDSSLTELLNYGMERDSPRLKAAAQSLQNRRPDVPYRIGFRGGDALDEQNRGGNRAIYAQLLANLGVEEAPVVREQMNLALRHFHGAVTYISLDDFTRRTTNAVRYYQPYALFPGANHVNILSSTTGWRSQENRAFMTSAFEKCLRLMQNQNNCPITFKTKTHFVGPFNFDWSFTNFRLDADSTSFVWWLRTMDRLSSIGFVSKIDRVDQAYRYLLELVDSDRLFTEQTEQSLKYYKAVHGIEDSWRKKESMQADLLFKAVFILFKAGYLAF